jgi:hypothetical protein
VILEDSTIGPFVSIGQGASINSSVLSDVIVEAYSKVANRATSYSIISQRTSIELEQEEIDNISKMKEKSSSTQID